MAELTEVVNDPEIAETFIVQRSQGGSWGPDGWTDNYVQLGYYGVVSIASPREVKMLPAADRIGEAIVVNCELPLYVTRIAGEGTDGDATSDIIVWNGDNYRVMQVHNYASRGYWWCIATRMTGA